MKINKKLLMLGATFALTAQIGTNAMAETATGTADVEVVTPLSIAIDPAVQLNFGAIAVGSTTGGTVSVSSGGVLSTTDSAVNLAIIDNSNASQGKFDIDGLAGTGITVTVPATATLSNGGTNLTANLSDSNPIVLDGLGKATLTVFGDLVVPAATPANIYSGNYIVTVEYN
jgi:hypothetical protein